MREESLRQLREAVQGGDGFAIAALGISHVEQATDNDSANYGLRLLDVARDKNIIFAHDLLLYIEHVRPIEYPILRHALISTEAQVQLARYAEHGNTWAACILAYLYRFGYTTPQSGEMAAMLLRQAAASGNGLAAEMMARYGIAAEQTDMRTVYDYFRGIDKRTPLS